MRLDNRQRDIIRIAVERELAKMREACLEDQGIEEGMPGTIGHEYQGYYKEIIEKMRTY